ncbi:fumarylacetoacetate hydrolase family protein [Bordetella petrii]|uniref:fumarylacetoacetate hydrolase family protein n=1 Tax=Bordetella petrii TaxID=94624 RepID=UPI001E647E96|nr:fumarylacetoacetate hydrolase family protein [Bordetella petrii]MCD0504472.1 fumarylacetoacetate hydrolase family protein [Bordetella petrii]
MNFLTFASASAHRLGVLAGPGQVLDLTEAWTDGSVGAAPPTHVGELIALGDAGLAHARFLLEQYAGNAARLQPLDSLRLLAPIPRPAKNVFCIGRNYREHIIEGNRARGRAPDDFPPVIEVFTKPPTAVIGALAPVPAYPHVTQQLDYEVELGVVIGTPGRDIPKERAMDHVFGYTIINDISARDLQKAHGQWFKGKALDGHCPMGPCIVHKSAVADPHSLAIQLDVNSERRQDSNTRDLLFRIDEIIAQLSAGLTLERGDIIATGTPSGVGLGLEPPRFLAPGDVVEARIEGLGTLRNPIGH